MKTISKIKYFIAETKKNLKLILCYTTIEYSLINIIQASPNKHD